MTSMASQAVNGAFPTAPPQPNDERAFTASSAVTRNHVEAESLVQGGLVELGIPHGLAEVVAKDDAQIGVRIYLLDNSGSMNETDGNLMCEQGQLVYMKPCTRWDEICAFAVDHARFNLMVGTPCEFVLLNSLGRQAGNVAQEGQDFVRVDRSRGNEAAQIIALETLLRNNRPRGVTPLAERLEEIQYRIKAEASSLAQKGQMVFLTIATDGLPTSLDSGHSTKNDQKRMIDRLRTLGGVLPLQLVIRLCTDDKSTIEFYNRIDEELEFPLDILDDLASEAREIAHDNRNNWFAYTPLVHRLREAGTLCKVLDSIDERPLRPVEVRYLAQLLSGSSESLAHLSDRDFIQHMQKLVDSRPHVYDAVKQRLCPVLDIPRLRIAMKVGFRGSVLAALLPCAL